MKWMYFVVFCATVADQIHARPGPNEFTHSNPNNDTEATTTSIPETPSIFTKDDESIIRRYLQQLNNSHPKNIEAYDGSNNNILNNFLKTSIDDLKQNRFTSIHSTIDPDSEPSKSYHVGIPNRYYEYEINEPEPGYVNVPHNPRPQTAIFTNIKPVFELENINPYPTRYNGVVRPSFVTTPTEATLISPLYHSSPTKVTKYHLITPKPIFNIRPTHRPYVNVYGYDPSDPDPNYDDDVDDYNQVDSLNFDNGYNNQPFNVKKKKKKKCNESPTNQYDPDCENFKLTLSQNVETTTAGHVIKIPNKGTSTHDNKLDLGTFDEKQKDPSCNGGCCDGTCTEPYPPVPIPNRPFFPPLNPFPLPQVPFPTPNSLLPFPIPQQIAPIPQAPASQTRPILSVLPALVSAGLTPLGLINKVKPKPDDDDDDGFDLDFFDFNIGGMKFGFKKMLNKLWPLAPYLFALNPLSLGFWTVVFSPVLLIVAGGTALTLFLYPWVSKMLVQTKQNTSVIVHKHPGKRPPTPSPWRVSPHQENRIKWTVKSKPQPFPYTRRKKRFVSKFSNNHSNDDDYGFDLMAYRYFRRF